LGVRLKCICWRDEGCGLASEGRVSSLSNGELSGRPALHVSLLAYILPVGMFVAGVNDELDRGVQVS
jgi:hypothetical protein